MKNRLGHRPSGERGPRARDLPREALAALDAAREAREFSGSRSAESRNRKLSEGTRDGRAAT